jgi:hypothetical protein
MKLHAFGYEISLLYVIPAKAGIQEKLGVLDPGDPVPAKAGSRGDDQEGSCEVRQFLIGSN